MIFHDLYLESDGLVRNEVNRGEVCVIWVIFRREISTISLNNVSYQQSSGVFVADKFSLSQISPYLETYQISGIFFFQICWIRSVKLNNKIEPCIALSRCHLSQNRFILVQPDLVSINIDELESEVVRLQKVQMSTYFVEKSLTSSFVLKVRYLILFYIDFTEV